MPADRLRWRDIRSTTPFRLTLLLGAIFLIALWATLAFSYLLTAQELTARSDRILTTRAKSLLAEPPETLPRRINAEIANATPGFSYFALVGQGGTPVVGNIALPSKVAPGQTVNVPALPGSHGPLRVMTVRTAAGETIVLGRDISQITSLRVRLMQILVASGVGGTLFVLLASVVLSIAPLRRVSELERVSRAIAAGAFQNRMPIAGRQDELDQFATTVNRMLDEVGYVVAQVKSATDAVAHDLRTPLTRVRAALDRARQGDVPPGERATIIEDALADLDHVIERFAALLRISEIESSDRRAGMRRLDMVPLIQELVDLYQPLGEDQGVSVTATIEPVSSVFADRELLFEALGNLLDNAIKFARSRVAVAVFSDGRTVAIEVRDDGPGIPDHEREAVMRRFHRAKGAEGVEGTGLGLAVVSAILHLHGATLEFGDAEPGLIATVRMPLST